MGQKELQKSIYPGSLVTVVLAMVKISTFVACHGVTKGGFQSLLDLISLLSPKNSKIQKFINFFNKLLPVNNVTIRYYCTDCKLSLLYAKDNFTCSCKPDTENPYTQKELSAKNCYFFVMSVKDQLKNLLQDNKLGALLKSH